MGDTAVAQSEAKWFRLAVFAVFAMIIAACASTSIEDSAAVQAAAAAADPTVEPVAEAVAEPVAVQPEELDAPVNEVDEVASEASDPQIDEQPEPATTPTTIPDLVDTPIVAAVSESGRAPAFFGGNPRMSLAEALQTTMPSVGGPDIDVSQYLGQDVVLWFWAPWCSWCNAEAQRVNTLATEFADQVEVVGVAGVSDESGMQDFVDRHDLEHITHLADFDGRFWFNLDVTYQPWWMFINDNGEVVLNWQGRLSEEEIRAVMDQLVST